VSAFADLDELDSIIDTIDVRTASHSKAPGSSGGLTDTSDLDDMLNDLESGKSSSSSGTPALPSAALKPRIPEVVRPSPTPAAAAASDPRVSSLDFGFGPSWTMPRSAEPAAAPLPRVSQLDFGLDDLTSSKKQPPSSYAARAPATHTPAPRSAGAASSGTAATAPTSRTVPSVPSKPDSLRGNKKDGELDSILADLHDDAPAGVVPAREPSFGKAGAAAASGAAPPFRLSVNTSESVLADGGRRVTLSGLERDVLGLLRRLRSDPQCFVSLIERARLPFFEGTSMLLTSAVDDSVCRFLTHEGSAAADDAIRELRRVAGGARLGDLKVCAGMTQAAKQGLPDGSSFGAIRQFGDFEGKIVECTTFDQHTAEDILLALLIDDGDAARTKRKMLLDPQFQHVGVAADSQKCIINLATRFIDK
jgi:hypothetical protein